MRKLNLLELTRLCDQRKAILTHLKTSIWSIVFKPLEICIALERDVKRFKLKLKHSLCGVFDVTVGGREGGWTDIDIGLSTIRRLICWKALRAFVFNWKDELKAWQRHLIEVFWPVSLKIEVLSSAIETRPTFRYRWISLALHFDGLKRRKEKRVNEKKRILLWFNEYKKWKSVWTCSDLKIPVYVE